MHHIQIILYNSTSSIAALIRGFNLVFENYKNFTIHFLENSKDETRSLLIKYHPKFPYTYLKSNTNLGFGKGHNYLFKKYGEKYQETMIILNPDIIPFYDFLLKIELFTKEIPPSWGAIDITQFPEEHPKEYTEGYTTEWVSGAGLIIRPEVFRKVGGFDSNFFMYAEDVDLSWRIREAGFDLFHCPTAKVLHYIGASTRTREENLEQRDSTFQRIHCYAGNLYLRYKYFNQKICTEYQKAIAASPEYNEAMALFNKMKHGLSQHELRIFRNYRTPKLYPDTNYAKHRW